MLRAILFDMGGTLDGDGLHWLDRFEALYRAAGVDLPHEVLRRAFDEAERRATLDERMMTARLEAMVERHVGWQCEALALRDAALRRVLVAGFVGPARAAAADNVRILRELSERGFRLCVVSNGCGNVDVLCDEFGFGPYLAAIRDSRRVGLFKPDPAMFVSAAAALDAEPETVLMVGDSFDRDIRPARRAGMRTAWLEGPVGRSCHEPALVDIRLRRLVDLLDAPLVREAGAALDGCDVIPGRTAV